MTSVIMASSSIKVERLTGSIGAAITGVELAALDPGQFEAIRDAADWLEG